jgi:hypothetical protein
MSCRQYWPSRVKSVSIALCPNSCSGVKPGSPSFDRGGMSAFESGCPVNSAPRIVIVQRPPRAAVAAAQEKSNRRRAGRRRNATPALGAVGLFV